MGLKSLFQASAAGRVHRSDPFWHDKKRPWTTAIVASFVLLQLLLLCNMLYMHGSLYRNMERTHNLNVLMVDYDHGIIGQSLRGAAKQLSASTFPSVYEFDETKYPAVDDLVHAVRRGDAWAGIYTHAGSSARLSAALGGGAAATSYNATNVVTWIYNEARYPTVEVGTIQSNMQKLVSATAVVYGKINGTNALKVLNVKDSTAVSVFLNPIMSSTINIKPTDQGTRVFYNTVCMVMPIIMQFFFLMAVNGLSVSFRLYSHLPVLDNCVVRVILSGAYTLIGSLCMTGYIWAYRENWAVGGAQFMLTWMTLWLYMHVNFTIIDSATAFIPQQFMAFFLITWVIFNVTSTVYPHELNPGFYHWSYALPAFETYQILIQVWSDGALDRLYQALPILFSWLTLGLGVSFVGMHYRCAQAAGMVKKAEQDFQNRLQASMEKVEPARSNSTDLDDMA